MFECNYKYQLEDSIKCAKYVYKSQRRKRDKVFAWLIPIMFVCVLAMFIYNVVTHKSFVWELIMLIAVVAVEIVYLMIPVMLVKSQKKAFKQQHLDQMDSLNISIDGNICVEKLFKDGKEVAKNVHSLRGLSSYLEDSENLILVFNQVEFVCIKKDKLTGGLEKLKAQLEKAMAKTTKKK